MTTAESRRHDLYNRLTEFLGAEQADTLMAYLPQTEGTELATKSDLFALEQRLDQRFEQMDQRFEQVDQRFDMMTQRLDMVSDRIESITQRLDRMVLAMVAGLVAIIATLVAQSFI